MLEGIDKGPLVILVQEDLDNCCEVNNLLRELKCQVGLCPSFEQLDAMISELSPCLLLLPMGQPVMKGIQACEKLKDSAGTAQISIILILRGHEEEQVEKAFWAGADDFICLPCCRAEWIARINTQLTLASLKAHSFSQTEKLLQEKVDRQELEIVLERGKREWEAAFDAVTEMLVLTDLSDTILRCNLATIRYYRSTYQALLHENISRLFPVTDSQGLPVDFQETKEIENPELHGWLAVTSYPFVVEGENQGKVYVIQDITARKKAERELRQSEKRTKDILNAVPDSILRLSRHGTVLDYKAGVSEFSVPLTDARIGMTLDHILPPHLRVITLEAITKAVSTGKQQVLGYPLIIAGKERHFEARLVPFGSDEVLMVLRDVSEQARLEQMKSDFINRASHELRSPLTAALLSLKLIEQGGSAEELAEYWSILRSELERQKILVERLLTVGRLETGNLKLVPTRINPHEGLQESLAAVSSLALSRGVKINVHFEAVLPDVHGDKQGFQQVFINLFGNAIKYSHPGGQVDVIAVKYGDGILVQVRDYGIGIPEDEFPRLFTRFYRGSNAVENEIPGTGIGLFIVKSILEELGGNVSVESRLNEGTLVKVWMPEYFGVEGV